MSEHSVFGLIERRLNEYKEGIQEHLATGGAATSDKYWVSVGEYSAYNKILDDLAELEKRYIET
jgi:hypothetical protein